MDQKEVERICDELVTRPGFKKALSGELGRLVKETATSKKQIEKAVKK